MRKPFSGAEVLSGKNLVIYLVVEGILVGEVIKVVSPRKAIPEAG